MALNPVAGIFISRGNLNSDTQGKTCVAAESEIGGCVYSQREHQGLLVTSRSFWEQSTQRTHPQSLDKDNAANTLILDLWAPGL